MTDYDTTRAGDVKMGWIKKKKLTMRLIEKWKNMGETVVGWFQRALREKERDIVTH
jgi:hypothetical protein